MNRTRLSLYIMSAVMAVAVTVCINGGGMDGNEVWNDTEETFTIEVMNGYTPVKNQKKNPLCWAYAMLAAIETEHIMRGDSVHLSVKYAVRHLIEERASRCYISNGADTMSVRGMGSTLLGMIERHGIVPYDAYRDDDGADITVLSHKVERTARKNANTLAGLNRLEKDVNVIVNETLGTPPRRVFMYGAEYTPCEFARSVCAPDEYIGMTSFTHHPFYTYFALEVPDNKERNELYNVPIDTLMATVERAVRAGRGVCWEGDMSEPGFSFERGTAVLPPSTDTSQEARQRAFERFETTDDHCMAIVGLARDTRGHLFYIMKNSWGTDNPYGGLMYLSENYVRMKTIGVYLSSFGLSKDMLRSRKVIDINN